MEWLREDFEEIDEFLGSKIDEYVKIVDESNIEGEDIVDLLDKQSQVRDHLEKIKEETSDVLPEKSALLIKGSTARWEHMPESSDYDFVVVTDVGWGPIPLTKIEEILSDILSEEKFDLVGVPYHPPVCDSDFIFSVRREDLLHKIGSPDEFSWAESVRIELLFESVFVAGSKSVVREIREEIRSEYSSDAVECLSLKLSLATRIHAYKTVISQLRNDEYSGQRMFKTAFSRIVSFSINALLFHSLFWIHELYPVVPGRTDDLRTPPLATLVNLARNIDERIENYRINYNRQPEWFFEKYNNLSKQISLDPEHLPRDYPLLEMYADLWHITKERRNDENNKLTEESKSDLKEAVSTFRKVVATAEEISLRFMREREGNIVHGISDDLLPIAFWDNTLLEEIHLYS